VGIIDYTIDTERSQVMIVYDDEKTNTAEIATAISEERQETPSPSGGIPN